MRYLIDTNIFLYLSLDADSLNPDVAFNEFFIRILPLKKEDMLTYSRLEINEAQDHKDPSDHVIISQAMTQRMPLISSDRKFKFYIRQGLNLVFNEK